jgi:hypothetical protein
MVNGQNVAIGFNALRWLQVGHGNIAIGFRALENLRRGSNNIAIGAGALADIVEADNQIQIGNVRLNDDDPELAARLSDALWDWVGQPVKDRHHLFIPTEAMN